MSDQNSLEIKQQYNIYIFIWYNLNGYCVYLSLSTHTCTVGLSLACASTCNLLLMRNSELSTGIEVEDHNGNVIGKSKVAAKKVKKNFASTNKKKNDLLNASIFIQEQYDHYGASFCLSR